MRVLIIADHPDIASALALPSYGGQVAHPCDASDSHVKQPAARRDEAIQNAAAGKILDCFAEPVIGPRFARTRWLAMTT